MAGSTQKSTSFRDRYPRTFSWEVGTIDLLVCSRQTDTRGGPIVRKNLHPARYLLLPPPLVSLIRLQRCASSCDTKVSRMARFVAVGSELQGQDLIAELQFRITNLCRRGRRTRVRLLEQQRVWARVSHRILGNALKRHRGGCVNSRKRGVIMQKRAIRTATRPIVVVFLRVLGRGLSGR